MSLQTCSSLKIFVLAALLGAISTACGPVPAPAENAVSAPAVKESPAPALSNEALAAQVRDTERAFAKTMSDRDHAAFVSFVSDEAVFFSGPKPLRGAKEVSDAWKKFFDKPEAPFSWEPADVEVLESGTLALSSGPVRDPSGKLIATFTSIWRLEAPGKWRIVFDRGNDVCE